jgi:SulP family sulfate permease
MAPLAGPAQVRKDLLSGLTVALALVPEAVAFAMIAGLDLMAGLHAAFIVGLAAAVFGGRPGMISGATGAMAVVLGGLSLTLRERFWGGDNLQRNDAGEIIPWIEVALPTWFGSVFLQYVCLAVLLAGVIQVLCGVLRLGKFIRLVPHPVMLGFVNGLAIVIGLAQLSAFKVGGEWLPSAELTTMAILVVVTMAIIYGFERITKAVPAPLVGIAAVTIGVLVLGIETPLVSSQLDLAQYSLLERLPSFQLPGFTDEIAANVAAAGITLPPVFSLDAVVMVLPFAIILASVGLIESLMTLSLIDEITRTRGRGNRECVGQGIGNVTCGFFQAMGGCAMIGQSMINISSGGRGRLSGISAAVLLLLILLFGGSLISMIPIAALVGVMFVVVIATFEWSSLRILHQVPRVDALVIVMVSAVTVATDNLALAVLIGVIINALAFAWKQAFDIHLVDTEDEAGVRVHNVEGVLFFGSVSQFRELFKPEEDPEKVILDFAQARLADHSAIEAVQALVGRYADAGKDLRLRHLSPDCVRLLGKAKRLVDVDSLTDPHYKVADDTLA